MGRRSHRATGVRRQYRRAGKQSAARDPRPRDRRTQPDFAFARSSDLAALGRRPDRPAGPPAATALSLRLDRRCEERGGESVLRALRIQDLNGRAASAALAMGAGGEAHLRRLAARTVRPMRSPDPSVLPGRTQPAPVAPRARGMHRSRNRTSYTLRTLPHGGRDRLRCRASRSRAAIDAVD